VTLGRDLAIVPAAAMDVVVLVAIISITLNPLAFSAIDRVDRWSHTGEAERVMSVGTDDDMMNARVSSHDPDSRAIVIGYGPTGEQSPALRENGISPTAWTLNIDPCAEALRR
jgi:CPA2 family monovalent cation:H+ antiporter-2